MAKAILRSIISPLTKGIFYVPNFLLIENGQAYKIVNCHIDETGMAYSRHGSRLINTTALDGAITSIYNYRRPDGASVTNLVLVSAGKKIYKWDSDSAAFVEIANLNSGARPDWVSFTDGSNISYAFMCNGTDFIKYDGTTVSTACASPPWAWGAPRYLQAMGDRVLAAGTDSDPYKVFVSGALDGTDFKPDSGSSLYWTVKGAKGDRVTGLGNVYNFGVIFQEFSTNIITAADPGATGAEQIRVSTQYGTTSNWSVQTVGNKLYFADESHIYRATLRDAIENGLIVVPCDKAILKKYNEKITSEDIVSAYDPVHEEIHWSFSTDRIASNPKKDTTLVYSTALSGVREDGLHRDVWSGWFTGVGYEPHTVGAIKTAVADLAKDLRHQTGTTGTDYPYIWRGDEDGYVYIMEEHEQYKDETRAGGVTTENAIVPEIITAAVYPRGLGMNKYARHFAPMLYQRYNNAIQAQWIIDGRYIGPDDDMTIDLINLVPYWNDGTDTDQQQLWSNTVWSELPVMPVLIGIDEPFNYIQFRITCDGSNARDEIAFAGGELYYQIQGLRITTGG